MAFFKADIDTSDVNRAIGDIRKYDGRTVLYMKKAVDVSIKAISKKAKQNAPKERGTLRKNIRSKLMSENKYGLEGWSFVKGGRYGAPHAHLIESGVNASTARPKNKKVMTIVDRGGFGVLGVRKGFTMSAHIPRRSGKPFLGPSYESEEKDTIARIAAAIEGKVIKN